jgi:aerobic carbon-monoxide dehydrogenase medium subunit
MQYCAPATLEEAFSALEGDDARCLAGGQSLVAMMNLGLVAPARLVSLRRIEALRGIAFQPDGSVRLGAMATHAELAELEPRSAPCALVAQAARVIAYPAVRMWGTIGGSVAHADPAADYPAALVAAGAEVELCSASGMRRVAAERFFLGLFETALEPAEIVTAIVLPPGPAKGAAYEKLSLVAGDFAIVSVAALLGREARIAVGGCGAKPISIAGVGASDAEALEAGRQLAERCDAPSDHRASAAYRRRVLPELVRRAVRAARQGAQS